MRAIRQLNAFHGGRFFEAIGEDFRHLERHREVVAADVLDAWFDPSPAVIAKVAAFLPFLLRTSPPVHARGLVDAIAQARGVPPECVLAGGGSSDLIFSCLPRLIGRGQRALILDPMYGEYRHILEEVIEAELFRFALDKRDEFRVDTERLIDEVTVLRPRVVTIVNPNSPTGRLWPRQELLDFIDRLPAGTIAVVDETYIEYAGANESIELPASERPNVIVLKSMSKVYALSGVRAGYMVAAHAVIRELARYRQPWAVSLPAQVAAVQALTDDEYYRRRWSQTRDLRESFAAELRRIPEVTVYRSCASFLLLELSSSAEQALRRMRRDNVFARNCDSMSESFEDRFLRIAVRPPHENDRIVSALKSALSL